jgi:hypothetical protein
MALARVHRKCRAKSIGIARDGVRIVNRAAMACGAHGKLAGWAASRELIDVKDRTGASAAPRDRPRQHRSQLG